MNAHTPRMIGYLALPVVMLSMTFGCGLRNRPDLLHPSIQNTLIDPNIANENYKALDPQFLDRLQETIRQDLRKSAADRQSIPINILAVSGGGIYGAFDVGVLCGWSESGKRPTFDVVTGISTGAFIGTFAFLGPKYDELLKEAYLSATEKQIYRKKVIVSGVLSASLASSEPLKKKIDAAITPDILKEVAEAHHQGRRFYVGTTNLDTRKLVIWDMGAIASSGKPNAIELYRNILLASGSVPTFFPPVYIDIEVDGKKYREMHVDGGTASSVFVRPFMMNISKDHPSARLGSHIYVISSGKLFADPDTVYPNVFDITNKAIAALIYAGGRSDIYSIYNLRCTPELIFI